MTRSAILAVFYLAASTVGYPKHGKDQSHSYPFPFVTREAWGAKLPRYITKISTPVPDVVVHHTYEPAVCMTREQCIQAMISMQGMHQDTNEWADIGYNFAVGGDGAVYEGRGWEAVGAHAAGINSQSIGISLIGDYVSQLPPAIMLLRAKQLIASGVSLGYISPNYKLLGHRQVSTTECPGSALFNEIQNWDRFTTAL